MADFGRDLLACAIAGTAADERPLRHVADIPARRGRGESWPPWVDQDVVRALRERGIDTPWSHQLEAANLAHAGRHVVISTGTASGKSLAYQLPILTALATDPRARALYLSPTKALGHDQLRTVRTGRRPKAGLRSHRAGDRQRCSKSQGNRSVRLGQAGREDYRAEGRTA